jgi:hypothetical protein
MVTQRIGQSADDPPHLSPLDPRIGYQREQAPGLLVASGRQVYGVGVRFGIHRSYLRQRGAGYLLARRLGLLP